MKFKRIFTVILISAFFASINAQSNSAKKTYVLTIDDAVQIALEKNISLKRSQIELDTDLRKKKTSWNSANPSLSVGAGLSKNNEYFTDNQTIYIQGSVNVTLSTNLYTNIKNAALKYQAGELNLESAKRTVEMNVRNAFYNLLYQDENVALQQTNLDTALTQYQTNQRKYNQGAISQLDVLTSQVNYEKNLPILQNAKITHNNNMALFKQMLGLEQNDEVVLHGELDEIIKIKSVSLDGIKENSTELAILRKNLEIAKNSLLASRFSAYGPTLSAGWSYRPTWVTNINNEGTVETNGPDDRGALTLSVTIPLDGLMPWSQRGVAVAEAKDSIKDLELQIKDKETSVKVASESSIRNIEQIIETIKTLESSVTLAEQSYQMTSEAYNRGTRNFTELVSARTSLEQARLNLKQQAYNLAAETLNLEDTLGIPFGTLINNANTAEGN